MPYTVSMKRSRLMLILILCVLALYAAWVYVQVAGIPCVPSCAEYVRLSLDNELTSPYRYRVLSPLLVSVLAGGSRDDAMLSIALVYYHLLVFGVAFFATYQALRRWVSPIASLLSVVMIVAYLPLMFQGYGGAFYTPLELALFALALWWRRPGLVYVLLVVLASLNRETGLILVLAFAAMHLPHWRQRRIQGWGLVYAALWLVTYVGIRSWRGAAPDAFPISAVFAMNTQSTLTAEAFLFNLFYSPLFVSVPLAWRWLNTELRRLWILVGIPYLLAILVFGLWNETRLLMPIMPLLTVALVTILERSLLTERLTPIR
jgi:hypothetical protein